jgi:hypothetical protein
VPASCPWAVDQHARLALPALPPSARWFDNVPIAGYAILPEPLPSYRERISIRYPVIELATAALFIVACDTFGFGWLFAARGPRVRDDRAVHDRPQHQILPNVITLPGIVAGLAFSLMAPPGRARHRRRRRRRRAVSDRGDLVAAPARGGDGLRRREDARDDRRVSRVKW